MALTISPSQLRRATMTSAYRVARAHATPAQWARAAQYSTLSSAWDAITPGMVARDSSGRLVAFHGDVLPWIESGLIK